MDGKQTGIATNLQTRFSQTFLLQCCTIQSSFLTLSAEPSSFSLTMQLRFVHTILEDRWCTASSHTNPSVSETLFRPMFVRPVEANKHHHFCREQASSRERDRVPWLPISLWHRETAYPAYRSFSCQ